MAFLVLDTDAASHLQKQTLPATLAAEIPGKTLCVTFVTVGEFYKGAYSDSWGVRRMAALASWLRNVVIIPYDNRVAHEWGRISAAGIGKGRPIAANDAWIAACCRVHGLSLMTLNLRHFRDVTGLDLV